MKALILVLSVCMAGSSFAGMRCQNDLILEGDSVAKMLRLCGTPDQLGQNVIYVNKDGDGFNYYIHVQANGIIDNIDYSRS